MHIFSGTHKGRTLAAPKGQNTRPTSGRLREAVFNICQHSIAGAKFLDLFAGSGAMGLEALSRGASLALFVEMDKEAIRCIQKNIESLGFSDKAKVFAGDAFQLTKMLVKRGMVFDIVFADPPYEWIQNEKILHVVSEERLLVEGGELFIENSYRMNKAQERYQDLELQSCREMGRSSLQHYKRQTPS